MQYLYEEVASLDLRCYDTFGLSEDLLMEHAAMGMATFIRKNFPLHSSVVIVVGSGNNGADGLTLARLLHHEYNVTLLYAKQPKSPMAILQHKRLEPLNIPTCTTLPPCDIVVDALVGTGFKGCFDTHLQTLMQQMNQHSAYKLACDVPSGYQFIADTTITMGALKKAMFLDNVKDCVGTIIVANLGIARNLYETDTTSWYLLEHTDIELPKRLQHNTHKGSFGHLAVVSGDKLGASVLCAQAALRFGTGLVTLIGKKEHQLLPYQLMYTQSLPHNTTAIACGMGLGENFTQQKLQELLPSSIPLVLDADILHNPFIKELIQRNNIVITPHPKEFVALLKLLGLADISIQTLQNERFKYVELFSTHYPNVTLLLKGANVMIAYQQKFYINAYGTPKLAKGGSGDVLAGLIGALLAQGYTPLKATITASLTHTKLATAYTGADFSLTPEDLIAGIGKL